MTSKPQPHLRDRLSAVFRLGRGLRHLWLGLGLLLLTLLLAEGMALLALKLAPPEDDVRWARAEVFADVPWTENLYREWQSSFDVRWEPYLYWRRKPFAGRWIQIDDAGLRRTWQSPEAAGNDDPFTIWVFGGSTVWGTGARDDHTLPSELARALADGHQPGARPVAVTNFGETGYVTTQEVLALYLQLRRGRRPDVAVFYHGVNDVASAFLAGQAGLPMNEDHRRRELNLSRPDDLPRLRRLFLTRALGDSGLARLARRLRGGEGPTPAVAPRRSEGQAKKDAALAREVAAVYRDNLALVEDLAASYGFEARFYLQPTLFSKRLRSPWEEQEYRLVAAGEALYEEVYRLLRADAELVESGRFLDLSQELSGDGTPYFFDWCHLSEEGNRRMAVRIAEDIVQLLQKRAP